MDPFAAIILVGFILFVVVIVLLGVYYPGSGLEQIGMRTARQITETREELDALDLDQMLSAHNSRRAAKGQVELSVDDLEMQLAEDVADQRRRRDAYLVDRELEQLLDATNARRRKRGLPERTRAQAEEELGRPPGSPGPSDPAPPGPADSAPPRSEPGRED